MLTPAQLFALARDLALDVQVKDRIIGSQEAEIERLTRERDELRARFAEQDVPGAEGPP